MGEKGDKEKKTKRGVALEGENVEGWIKRWMMRRETAKLKK